MIGGLAIAAMQATSWAQTLEPQNRVHAGVSVAGGGVGAAMGLDSRMTRLVFVDVGGFVSPADPPAAPDEEPEDLGDYVTLQHGLFVAPGVRVPHMASERFAWDLIGRLGFGVVWSADTDPGNQLAPGESWEHQTDPAVLGGVDLVVRRGSFGGRAGGKAFLFHPYSQTERKDLDVTRALLTVEALYEW